MAALTDCEIHIFDPTPGLQNKINSGSAKLPPRTSYHDIGLVAKKGEKLVINNVDVPAKTLSEIMQSLKHTHVDVLKIDIEGSERSGLFDDIAWWKQHVGLFLIELHLDTVKPLDQDLTFFSEFIEQTEVDLGFKMYHAEMNIFDSWGMCWEFVRKFYLFSD